MRKILHVFRLPEPGLLRNACNWVLPSCPSATVQAKGEGQKREGHRERRRENKTEKKLGGERLSAPFSWLYVFVKRQGRQAGREGRQGGRQGGRQAGREGGRQPQRQQQTRLAEWENNFLLVFVRAEAQDAC